MPRSRLFALVSLAACVVLAALGLVNLLHIDLPPFVFLGQLTIPCVMLAAGLGFVGIVLQLKRVVVVAAIAAGLLAASLFPWLMSRAIDDYKPGPRYRVMYAYAPQDNKTSPLLRNFIARSNPDLIVLTEPSSEAAYHPREVLGPAYPHSRQIGRINLFSKTPLDTLQVGALDDRIMSMRLTSRIGPLTLKVVRLPRLWPYSDWDAYNTELARLKRLSLEARDEPTLVLGDFNASLSAAPLLNYSRETDFRPVTSPIGTWPAHMPPYLRLAIDNAFVSPVLTGTKFSVGPEYASDHRPIVVEIQTASGKVHEGDEM